MDVDVTFIGLCSFLNLKNDNPSMPEPSVILIRTDPGANFGPALHASGDLTVHTPFIAFDSAAVKVDDGTGFKAVSVPQIAEQNMGNFDSPEKLQNAATFSFLTLSNAELTIENLPPGTPAVDVSYGDVAKKDDYWPGTKNQWNRDLVPKPKQRPSSSVVAAFLRFGGGKISAGYISKNEWEFRDEKQKATHKGRFAREVHYTFPQDGKEVVIVISALDGSGTPPRTLRFSPVDDNGPLTIWIGNSTERGIAFATQHVSSLQAGFGDHFAFLNQVVKLNAFTGLVHGLQLDLGAGSARGPIPVEITPASASAPVPEGGPLEKSGGEEETGYCGPQNGSGGPPPP